MRALVIGGSGQVGAALEKVLVARGHTAVATHHQVARPGTVHLDVRDAAASARVITDVEPDVIFCPAGLTFVAYCEDHPDDALQANCEEPQGKNFIYQLRRRAAAGETSKVPADQRSSPTFNVDLATATVELVEHATHGVVHVAGPSVIDRYAFARMACDVFELDTRLVVPVATADLQQRAARPLNAGLRIDRVRRQITTPLHDPTAGLAAMRATLEGRAVDTTRGHR